MYQHSAEVASSTGNEDVLTWKLRLPLIKYYMTRSKYQSRHTCEEFDNFRVILKPVLDPIRADFAILHAVLRYCDCAHSRPGP